VTESDLKQAALRIVAEGYQAIGRSEEVSKQVRETLEKSELLDQQLRHRREHRSLFGWVRSAR